MRNERGFTLVEVLVAMGLMTVVLGAVLTTFENFQEQSRRTTSANEAQEKARRAIDVMAREVRNAVSAGAPVNDAVERALPFDLVFQTAGAGAGTATNPTNRVRVRYCLDGADGPNGGGKLYRQTQTFPGAPTTLPAGDTTCPLPSWTTTQVVTGDVTNRVPATDVPVFTYRFTPSESTALTELVGISPEIRTDPWPKDKRPAESVLRSGIVLRNANQPPVALFSATVQSGYVKLNGSPSIDPEQQTMEYRWYIDGVTNAQRTGIRHETAVPAGSRTIRLVVTDAAGATAEVTQSLVVP